MQILEKRIIVIGNGGAGKSTFARELASITKLPLIHLDKEFWNPGWVTTPKDEWIAKQQAIVLGDSWILDGNYGNTLEIRLARAEIVLFLDFGRIPCLYGAVMRFMTHINRTARAAQRSLIGSLSNGYGVFQRHSGLSYYPYYRCIRIKKYSFLSVEAISGIL